jgi:threonine/homoserine/homoserine lactone efflux protein
VGEKVKNETAVDVWKKTSKYVQFSKKMIVGISVGFVFVSIVGMLMSYLIEASDAIVSIVKIDGIYAILAFIAYSGNSMLEKWLVKHSGGTLGSELNDAFTRVSINEDK